MTAPGWLAEQLPRALADDPFISRFVLIFEHIGGGLRSQIDELDHYFDIALGPLEFVRWMASWVGQPVDSALPEDRQRSLAKAIGPLFPYRGTQKGLQAVIEALTRSDVDVEDSGGVFSSGAAPGGRPHVIIKVTDTGDLDEQQLLRIVQNEVPADTTLELIVGSSSIETAEITDELERMIQDSVELGDQGKAQEPPEKPEEGEPDDESTEPADGESDAGA